MFMFLFVITNRVLKSLSNIKIAFRSKISEILTKIHFFHENADVSKNLKFTTQFIKCHSVPILVYYNRGKFHVCTRNINKVIECSIFPRGRFLIIRICRGVQLRGCNFRLPPPHPNYLLLS